jgi:hypothetical protein
VSISFIFVIWPRCPAGNELAPPDTALKYYTLTYRLQKGHLANYVNLLPMTASGQSMPMRSAPMSHDVGNCLKADVPGSGGKVKKTVTFLAAFRGAATPYCRTGQ